MKDKPATEYALLGSLMSAPRHGYEILQFLESGLGPAWRVSTSQLYALLKRLDNEGLVNSTLEAQDTRPSKRVFAIMPAGRERFLKWLKSPTDHARDLRIEFLAKLYFFRHLGLDGGDELLNSQAAILERLQKRLTDKKKAEEDDYNRLVYGFKISTLKGWRDWLKKEAAFFL
jgi:PadR family transcriptional regulator AphA